MGGDTANDDLEACKHRKKRRFSCNCSKYVILIYNSKKYFIFIHLACLIFGLIYLFIKPVQRGFFCDDTSVQYPFRPDTIPMWLLAIYGGVGPIIIVSDRIQI
jgi:hypothetical protein